ncbi:MAG: transposase [Planctomycetota bacterium]|nr:transposase [Planctomycetota bacterium]
MTSLDKSLRRQLENAVKDARDVAEAAARATINHLGVGEASAPAHLSGEERELRKRLRIHGHQLGDQRDSKSTNPAVGTQETVRLVEEVAYEHWHRMLFARFLAENNLLMYPDPSEPVAVSIQECDDLAADEKSRNGWELAARFAAKMLPEIFRTDSPVFQLDLPPEGQQRLEHLLVELPGEVFQASDSLGWVYQFWQAKRKDQVNASEVKIGARELPAVTQLFTEDYMVAFLLDNTLGAWWAGKVAAASSRCSPNRWSSCHSEAECRRLCELPNLAWNYLRFIKVEAASSRLNPNPNQDTRQDAASTVGFYRKDDLIANLSGNLPHWRQDAVTYFVTFRSADSLPQDKLKQWQSEREDWLARHPEPHDQNTKREYHERFPERLEHWLDQGYGDCRLKEPALRKVVEDALRHFDGERYDLDEFVVSANHVHVLVTPRPGYELSDILHSWKSFTANQINRQIAQSGAFWQKESFDHIVRNPAQLERLRKYIRAHDEVEVEAASSRLENNTRKNTDEDKRQDAASTWRPAAGTFPGWPKTAAEITVLDPCMGSGHFLVFALPMLAALRTAEEGLSPKAAVDAVLRDNLFGLEIDPRCAQIAAFNLALAAWRRVGYRPLPAMNLACSGLAPNTREADWLAMVGNNSKVQNGMERLYRLFQDAPVLGSLINPRAGDGDLLEAGFHELQPLLEKALAQETKDDTAHEMAVTARGLAKAAEILAGQFTLVATNVPYLGRGKQDDTLKKHLEKHYPEGKSDLATAFMLRCLEFCKVEAASSRLNNSVADQRQDAAASTKKRQDAASTAGTTALVTPQNWLFLTTYTKLRARLLRDHSWNVVARLGTNAFQDMNWWAATTSLLVLSCTPAFPEHVTMGIDVSVDKRQKLKIAMLRGEMPVDIAIVPQTNQIKNPDARIAFDTDSSHERLEAFAICRLGLGTGDAPHYLRQFWELVSITCPWSRFQTTTDKENGVVGGYDSVVAWDSERRRVLGMSDAERKQAHNQDYRGREVWGRRGVAVSIMSSLRTCDYSGDLFDKLVAAIVPIRLEHLEAVSCYVQSQEFVAEVRKLDQKVMVTNATLIKVPFDLAHWQNVAAEKYPHGLSEPESDDPTQWLFHGYPGGTVEAASSRLTENVQNTRQDAASTLQVAVARLLGYRWPAELDAQMRLSDRARDLVRRCDELLPQADQDGLVCIPAVRGEATASDRLLNLLAKAYGTAWSTDTLNRLLKEAGYAGKTLETWLRDGFFAQHCELFHQRPFLWQIWDGLRDGFSILVNYHRLDRKNLETLIYTYLGDWIGRQKQDQTARVDGAGERLAAAVVLQKKLELIRDGESPYDIFVRWKPLDQQPIGWEPDLNDGVRLNIRPFVSAPDVKTKGAGVLRGKPKIKWEKDRGKEPQRSKEDFPWFWGWDGSGDFQGGPTFTGERFNDCHYTIRVKTAVRGRHD